MLSSSDSKWRCMWHMFVWSVLLALVSQFLRLHDYWWFYVIGALSVLVLPVFTAVYSNTEGRHCAELLRVAYVIADPVLACMAVTPVMLLNQVPRLLAEQACWAGHHDYNTTADCVTSLPALPGNRSLVNASMSGRLAVIRRDVLIAQTALVAPVLLAVVMWKRTRKMNTDTYLLTVSYWLVAAIETADLLQLALEMPQIAQSVSTSESIVSILMIALNSYAIITLVSFISPAHAQHSDSTVCRRFNLLYKGFVCVGGACFCELPLLAARVQILLPHMRADAVLPGTFHLWLLKNLLLLAMLVLLTLWHRLRRACARLVERPVFDNPHVVFQPEKRDVYIQRKKQVRFRDPPDARDVRTCDVTVREAKQPLEPSNYDAAVSTEGCNEVVSTLHTVTQQHQDVVTEKTAGNTKWRDLP